MQTAVHQLWPPPGDLRKTEMNILFFHSYPRDSDEWKSSWTQRSHPDVCWPEKWLPADLGFDVRVLFVSYGQSSVADVVDDLFKALIIRDKWNLCKNHQPLVLVGRGFGTKVLDDFFLKATEEVSTSPTEAGAFVRNVRGVTLYGDDVNSYKIEKFFGGKSEDIQRVRVGTSSTRLRHCVFITQGSMLINPAIDGKNLTRQVVRMDPCQWKKADLWEDWDPEVRWKPESKQSPGYNLLLESCRKVYQFEAIRATLEHLQQKLDNIIRACGISNYSDYDFKDEFTYLRHNGIEGAKILIVQRMLATMGVDVEQYMVAKKSDDGEQLAKKSDDGEQLDERMLAMLKFTVARFCESHEWHMVPIMKESDMQQKIESSVNDIVDGIPPLSDDVVMEKMLRERERERRERERGGESHFSGREVFHRDGNDIVPIHFPSIRKQSTMSVKQLQQLACNMRPGKNLPQEDVQDQLMAHMAQVLDGGKLIVTANILEGKIQFLFGNGKSMAQIVGVGLDFATVSLTRQNVILVEGITELEWTRLWREVFLGESLFENPIFMEEVVISPSDHEELQGADVNALTKVAMFFMIQKILQKLDVGKVYNQAVRDVPTTMPEVYQSDVGQVHAESDDDRSTGILGFNLWDYFSSLQITGGLGSATRDTGGEGGSQVGDTDISSEEDEDQDGAGGRVEDSDGVGGKVEDQDGAGGKVEDQDDAGGKVEDQDDAGGKVEDQDGAGGKVEDQDGAGGKVDGDGKGRGAKQNVSRQNRHNRSKADKNQDGKKNEKRGERNPDGSGKNDDAVVQRGEREEIRVTVIPGFKYGVWKKNSVPEQLEGSGIVPTPEQLQGTRIDLEQAEGSNRSLLPEQLERSDINPTPDQLEGSDIDPIPEQLKKSYISPTLEFVFKENIIESDVSVSCCMNDDKKCITSERFGWFHNELVVSFQCTQSNAASPSSKLLGVEKLKYTISEQTQTIPPQLNVKLFAGSEVTLPIPLKNQLNQEGREVAPNFIIDTIFRAECVDGGGETPMVRFKFKLWPEVPTNKVLDSSDEGKYPGMFSTVVPHFKADWTVAHQDGTCPYVLEVYRHACELVSIPKKWWKLRQTSCACNKMLQTYMVTLHINHKMSTMTPPANSERILSERIPNNKLIGINMKPK